MSAVEAQIAVAITVAVNVPREPMLATVAKYTAPPTSAAARPTATPPMAPVMTNVSAMSDPGRPRMSLVSRTAPSTTRKVVSKASEARSTSQARDPVWRVVTLRGRATGESGSSVRGPRPSLDF